MKSQFRLQWSGSRACQRVFLQVLSRICSSVNVMSRILKPFAGGFTYRKLSSWLFSSRRFKKGIIVGFFIVFPFSFGLSQKFYESVYDLYDSMLFLLRPRLHHTWNLSTRVRSN